MPNPPISVLVVTPWFPNRPGDQEGNFIYESASALARKEVRVGVLVTRPFVPRMLERFRPYYQSNRLEPRAFPEFAEVAQATYVSIPRNWLWRVTQWHHDRRVGAAIDKIASSLKPDLIHAHTEGEAAAAVQAAGRLGIAAVVTLHGINPSPRYFGSASRRGYFRRALRAASRVVLVGNPLRQFFLDIAGDDENFCVVPNGVKFPTQSPTRRIASEATSVRFISVSNLHEGKGIDITLDALAAIRARGFEEWDYTVVGDGLQRAPLIARANELGLADKVRFLGRQPHDQVIRLLDAADVFVLPSYREAFGVAYLEAMAAGLVTIGVADQGPSAFITDGETGFQVPPRDSAALSELLFTITKDHDAMRRVAEAGREHARGSFSWELHADRLIGVYRDVLDGPKVWGRKSNGGGSGGKS